MKIWKDRERDGDMGRKRKIGRYGGWRERWRYGEKEKDREIWRERE